MKISVWLACLQEIHQLSIGKTNSLVLAVLQSLPYQSVLSESLRLTSGAERFND